MRSLWKNCQRKRVKLDQKQEKRSHLYKRERSRSQIREDQQDEGLKEGVTEEKRQADVENLARIRAKSERV